MKTNISLITRVLCLSLVLVACEKRDPEFFDEEANGAYFDYQYNSTNYDKELNFGDYIVGDPDTVTLSLKAKLLGYLMEEERTLAVKTKPIKGYSLANILIDDVVFANKEYEKDIEVQVLRPEMEDTIYAVCIYLDGSGDIGLGVNGMDSINLYVTESYPQPIGYSDMEGYLGSWSKEKKIFLARHTGDDHFFDKLYDQTQGIPINDAVTALHVSAVNALLAHKDQVDGMLKDEIALVADFPILHETYQLPYAEPYFWKEYEEYLGVFRTNKFCRFTSQLGGSNTANIAALYASEQGKKKMEEVAADFNIMDVLEMLDDYYDYAKQGLSIAEYDMKYWVKMIYGNDYKVRKPFWWEDPNHLGTAEIVEKYFGEYDEAKYKRMLQVMVREEGEDNFIAASLFPFVYDAKTGTYGWDPTPLGKNNKVGEERLKECYVIIKKKDRLNEYNFPVIDELLKK